MKTAMRLLKYLHLDGKGIPLFIGLIAIVGIGCSHGDNMYEETDSASDVKKGVFLDSAVEGLAYETDTQYGVTDEHGTFTYMDNETIMFSLGDTVLGQAGAEPTLTPVDLVPGAVDETHPTVINICRFLQTLDHDGDPENGITITEEVGGELEDRNIDFDMDPTDFEHDPDMQNLIDTLNGMPTYDHDLMMVSTEQAQRHMQQTLLDMQNNMDDMMDDENMMGSDEMMPNGDMM